MGEQRFQEYMPFPEPNLQDVQGDAYVAFVADTLKPVIDRDFRTLTEARSTGIAGSSLGGLISLYALFRRPETFGSAGVFSPALRWGAGGIFPFVQKAPFAQAKIYMDVGAAEGIGLVGGSSQRAFARRYLKQVRKMHALLLEKGYREGQDLRYVEEEEGIHHESAWARRLPDALRFLLSGTE
jgi:predicted alpha/beta superfamily hydrolase